MNEKGYKYLIISVLILAVLNIFLIGFIVLKPSSDSNEPRPIQRKTMNNDGAGVLMGKLDLTMQQRQQFKQLFRSFQIKRDSIDQLLRANSSWMIEQKMADNLSSEEQDSIIRLNQLLHQKMELETMLHFENVRDICTEGQIQKLGDLMRETRRKNHPRFRRSRRH